jgi:LysM repeat protein
MRKIRVFFVLPLVLLLIPVAGCGPSGSENEIENLNYRIKRLETRVAALELNNDTLNELDTKVKRISEENERRHTALILQVSKLERMVQSPPPVVSTTPTVKKTLKVNKPETPTPPAVKQPPNSVLYHKVGKGDTLYSISRQYGLKPSELKRLNGLDSNIISPGQELRVR